MIVEEQGIGFWTRVQIPSTPLKHDNTNSLYDIVVYKNMFCLVYWFKGAVAKVDDSSTFATAPESSVAS